MRAAIKGDVKFNLAVVCVLGAWSMWSVGRLADAAASDGVSRLLVLLIVLAVIGVIWRGTKLRQEPAVFAAVSYVLFGAIAVAAEALAGDLTRAVIGGVLLPFLPIIAVEEPQTRRWINRCARYSPVDDARS